MTRTWLLVSTLAILISPLRSAGTESCEKAATAETGLTRAEATVVFDLVDSLQYELRVCNAGAALSDTMLGLQVQFWRDEAELAKSEADGAERKILFYALGAAALAAVSVWAGAAAAR